MTESNLYLVSCDVRYPYGDGDRSWTSPALFSDEDVAIAWGWAQEEVAMIGASGEFAFFVSQCSVVETLTELDKLTEFEPWRSFEHEDTRPNASREAFNGD